MRILRNGLSVFVLGAMISLAAAEDRPEDRAAIRAHIDSIFKAFINKDAAKLRETHSQNWRGYLEGSRTVIKGIDDYMKAVGGSVSSPYGMTGYTMREFDIVFYGPDLAFVSFVADVDSKTPRGPRKSVLRIVDLYAREKNGWNQAGSHTTVHPEAQQRQLAEPGVLPEPAKKRLLEAREAVWRAWFHNDQAALDKLLPGETVTISPAGQEFPGKLQVMKEAAEFAKTETKLLSLEFPKTEIQLYGVAAFVYSTYAYELERDGKRQQRSGRVTEVFVFRDGQWVNPGWHMDTAK